jgi:hypothetical protein
MGLIKSKSVVLFLAVSLLLTVPALSQYEISWYTIDGGGGTSKGGPYVLTGTIGQPDAAYSSGDNYELLGGFWPSGALCIIEFDDLARFCDYWLETGAGIGADLDQSQNVDFVDYSILADIWLNYCPNNWPLK